MHDGILNHGFSNLAKCRDAVAKTLGYITYCRRGGESGCGVEQEEERWWFGGGGGDSVYTLLSVREAEG